MKELYEPLWDELLKLSKSAGFRIRSIWIADVAQQGWSSVLNEQKLGNDRTNPIQSQKTETVLHTRPKRTGNLSVLNLLVEDLNLDQVYKIPGNPENDTPEILEASS